MPVRLRDDRRRPRTCSINAIVCSKSCRTLVQVQTSRAARRHDLACSSVSGQVLVIGANSAQLAVTPGSSDPLQPQVVLRGVGPDVNVTQFVSGGELGGIIDFNREMLAPARSELGRIAVGLVSTVNAVHRNGMDAEGAAWRRFLLDQRAAILRHRFELGHGGAGGHDHRASRHSSRPTIV